MSEKTLYSNNNVFVNKDDILYPVTHMFVVKERKEGFKFIVQGEARVQQQYFDYGGSTLGYSTPIFDIDWGDGNISVVTENEHLSFLSHVYEETKEYIIAINNHVSGMIMLNSQCLEILTPFPKFGDDSIQPWIPPHFWISSSASNKLRKVCGKLYINNSWITTMRSPLFSDFIHLKHIPGDFFEGLLNLTDVSNCFYRSHIETVGDGLFKDKKYLQNGGFVFNNCTYLQTIGNSLFENCYNLQDVSSVFSGCSNLKEVGINIFENCINIETFHGIFTSCVSLETINTNIFHDSVNAKSFQASFVECKKLDIQLKDLFSGLLKVEDFAYCFTGCEELKGEAPELWLRTNPVPKGIGCFRDCRGLSNYDDIPSDWK